MTIQEEIREGVKELVLEVRQYLCNTEFAPEPFTEPIDPDVLTKEFPNRILTYLHAQKVVIAVERELPALEIHCDDATKKFIDKNIDIIKLINDMAATDFISAGYTAVEPLI